MLDTAEYIHLAMHASKNGDTHSAMSYLKEALAEEPDNAVARYLLAAEHAEIGLYDKAIHGMEEAIRLAPALEIAQFQLGLLYLQTNKPEDSYRTFETLAAQTQDAALIAFSRAYLFMIKEDAVQAIPLLNDGIAICTNEHLKADMQRVLASLATPDNTAIKTEEQGTTSAFMLGAYRDSLEH